MLRSESTQGLLPLQTVPSSKVNNYSDDDKSMTWMAFIGHEHHYTTSAIWCDGDLIVMKKKVIYPVTEVNKTRVFDRFYVCILKN